MNKISDYSILDILQAAGVETMRTGNNVVCRCPICKSGESLCKDNFEAQINDNSETPTLYCHSCGQAYTRTELIDELDLYSILNIEKYEPKPTPAPAPAIDNNEIERLLTAEIPTVLWDKTADSFKNIGLTKWSGENRLLFVAPNASTITKNAGSIKWKWSGSQPIFNRLTDKKLVFMASGVAEWLILDWLGFDYIVLPTDSKKAGLAGFKEQLIGKAVIVLPDHDKSGSFDKVIEAVKAIAERVHVCNFYQDHDFRDYARRTAPAFNKEQFIDSLFYNIFIELGGNETVEQISESDIHKLIEPQPQQAEAEQEQELPAKSNLFDLTKMFVKPEPLKFIFRGFRENTVGIFAGTGGVGKSYVALAFLLTYADATCKLNYLNLFENNKDRRGKCGYFSLEDDKELIHHRLYNLRQYFYIKKTDNKLIENLQIDCRYGQNFKLADKNFNKIVINKEAEKELYNFCAGKKFVVIDTLRRLSNLNENDSSETSYILRTIEKISYETNCSILINSHVSKAEQDGKNKVRGASSITDDTRFTLLLDKKLVKNKKGNFDKKQLFLCFEKVNAIKIPEAIPLQWQEWINKETRENYSMITDMEDNNHAEI
jgi:RecA-family ATPase/uncharacterized protein YbaR (Trm112 family)